MMQQILEQDSKHEAWSYHVWADNLLANENRIENDTNAQKVFVVQSYFYIRSQYNSSHRFFLIINYKLSTLD